ncbi:hypothetical protein [Sediminispirochaeta bajacaliforniensis]|uniref:hypothetical protein n=1 Tax=Sediminispirochaeta bajacaliforniensis TaxID=148 RepID=UPI00037FEB60|nr:hypothetical protein [Sediminispirochaeta bajacaliforniensis]
MDVPNRISKQPAVLGALIFMTRKKSFKAAFRVVHVIVRHFFLPQFARKFRLVKTPVVNVDHPLDRKIPFSPKQVKLYLSFTHLWIRSLLFLYREFGEVVLQDISDYVDGISELYLESAKIYRRCMSTTDRPQHVGGLYFRLIHLSDPHLLCVPSLHVEIVSYNFHKICDIIDRYAKDPTLYEKEKRYLWEQAISITDSILFLKQHSVNCVAAGLFVLSSGKSRVSPELARKVITNLLSKPDNGIGAAEEIRNYILALYNRFEKEGEKNPVDKVLLNFLYTYDRNAAADTQNNEKSESKVKVQVS